MQSFGDAGMLVNTEFAVERKTAFSFVKAVYKRKILIL